MRQSEFHSVADHTWNPIDPGVTQALLNEDPTTGRRTLLQRWEPGASNARLRPFVHDYVEEIYMAEGDLYDMTLGQGWSSGAYAYRKPGMEHGPFQSEGGCLMFVVCIPVDGEGKEVKGG